MNRHDFSAHVSIPLFDEFGAYYNAKTSNYHRVILDDFLDGFPNRWNIKPRLQNLIDKFILIIKFEYLFSPHITIDPNWLFNNVPVVLAYYSGDMKIRDIFKDDFFIFNSPNLNIDIFQDFLKKRYPNSRNPEEENSSAWLDMYRQNEDKFYKGPRVCLDKMVSDISPQIKPSNFCLLEEMPGVVAANKVHNILNDKEISFDQFCSIVNIYYFPSLLPNQEKKLALKEIFEKISNQKYLQMSKIKSLKSGYLKEANEGLENNNKFSDHEISWFFRHGFYLPAHAECGFGHAAINTSKNLESQCKNIFTLLNIDEEDIDYFVDKNELIVGDRKYKRAVEEKTFILESVNKLNFEDIKHIRQREYWLRYRERLEVLTTKWNSKLYLRDELFNEYVWIFEELIGELALQRYLIQFKKFAFTPTSM